MTACPECGRPTLRKNSYLVPKSINKIKICESALERFTSIFAPIGAKGGRIMSSVPGFFCHIHTLNHGLKIEYDPIDWEMSSERVFFD